MDQAAAYGGQLGLTEITQAFFVEFVDDANRRIYEKEYVSEKLGVKVIPVFVEIGK